MLLQLPPSYRTLANECIFSALFLPTNAVCRYKITVYQCKYDAAPALVNGVPAYTWNTLQHGLDATNDECISSVDGVDNYYAILEKYETTIASTNGKTSITYGCDAHRAKSPRRGASFSSRAPPFNPHASVAP